MAMLKTLQYLITLSVIFECTSGLYFHIGETERKCFIEEIPDETTVLGIPTIHILLFTK